MSRLTRLALVVAAGMLAGLPAAGQEKLKVGFMTTLSGGGALLGEELKRGWELGVEQLDGKIGGLETEVITADDQLKPDVAVSAADRLIKQERVDVVAGVLWSNIMLAIYEPVTRSGAIMLSTNAGPPQLAGKQCNPLYISTSWQNDQFPEATAAIVNADKMENTYLLAPNYQAGKDIMSGFELHYKGKIVGQKFFQLGQSDFQPELSQIRAEKPASLVVFAPGAMGIAFLKQWQALGLGKSIKLYTINMVDNLTLPVIGETVVGTYHVSPWDPQGKSPANERFVAAYKAKYGKLPSQYAAQSYDGVFLLDSGIRAVNGNLKDKKALVAAMRQAKFESVRGKLTYNVNNFPIQDMYRREVVLGPDGKPLIQAAGVAIPDQKDAHYKECGLTW